MGSPKDNNGPDGSSIRPVSSLLARFENMSKPNENTQPTPSPRTVSPSPSPIPAPAPKPDLGVGPAKEPPAIPIKPKPRDTAINNTSASLQPPGGSDTSAPRSWNRLGPPPPLSPRPIGPPSLLVDPPQSPPKGLSLNLAQPDQPSYLNPDAVVKQPPPVPSPRGFKIPSRPHSPAPALEPRKSPRLNPAQPPSPPPPRRSAELRWDRDARPVPPPINRAEKPKIPAQTKPAAPEPVSDIGRVRNAAKRSPFSSPPDSGGSGDEAEGETPPELPTRPRPRSTLVPKAMAFHNAAGFEPPPVHHSIASKRPDRGHDTNGTVKGSITPQLTGEARPGLPTRPSAQTAFEPPPPPLARHNTVAARAPPRTARPGIATTSAVDDPTFLSQKRAVSTPTTSFPPPPTRTQGKIPPVDRSTKRPPPGTEYSVPATTAVSTIPEGKRATDSAIASAAPAPPKAEMAATAYPDPTNSNRRPPHIKQGAHEIATKYDGRIFDVCGEMVCTSGHLTRVWSLLDGELLMSLAHGEGVKATSIAFKPGANVDGEGARLWVGNNIGEIMEADIATRSITNSKQAIHGRYEVIRIYKHYTEMWTLDEGGGLHVWGPGEDATPNVAGNPHQSFRVPKGHTFSIVMGDELWHATGKEIRVFLPTLDGKAQFQVLIRALYQEGAGEVTSGTFRPSEPTKAYFGHSDGKVSIYSRKDYSCLGLVSVSSFKINSLAGVGPYIWAGFNTGKMCVYDIRQTPWGVKKEWQAHDGAVVRAAADCAGFYKIERSQVVSLGIDNMLRTWDGLLQEDWLEDEMQSQEESYCDFEQIRALAMTWNAGASTPNSLRYSGSDGEFFKTLLQSSDSPDILVFGFQELVDLEDKTAQAKRLFKSKKKEGSDQERMSHQYRDWRDYLVRSLDDYVPSDLYHLLQTAHLVGLFTCVFVKADLRARIRNLSTAQVKRGMGGVYGNKGAIVVRFHIDDTSICLVNCHLAAGQSHAAQRHADIAAIMEATILAPERDHARRFDLYVGGGDGTMVLDHELCLLNGDLNYRIDTMSRDTVVTAVKAGNLAKLLERDQLLVARRRNPAFRLRAFDELPLTFAPTYKYDVGTDVYDSSEKRRSPAWCDRLLFRGGPHKKVRQLDYRRHEVRVSDHRPVTGRFELTIKRVDAKRRAVAWMEAQQAFEDLRAQEAHNQKLDYLTRVIGYDSARSKSLIRDSGRAVSRRARADQTIDNRSPSRHLQPE